MRDTRSTGIVTLTPPAAELLQSAAAARLLLVVMGVSGCGKSSVGQRLADTLHWPFLEGDSLHSPANITRMQAGQPLDDDARRPWLDAIGEWLAARRAAHGPGIVACSALKRSYRDRLRGNREEVCFAWLHVSPAELRRRLAMRTHHFMPPALLDSQLRTLEPPQPDEAAIRIDADGDLDTNAKALLATLSPPG